MNGFDAYKLYIAIRNHFTTEKYDFIKFNGKTKTSLAAYEKRRDVYQFRRLGALPDPQLRLVACMLNDITFINDVLGAKGDQAEKDYRRIVEGGSYACKSGLTVVSSDVEKALTFHDGRYPDLLQKYISGQLAIQHVIAVDSVFNCIDRWDRQFKDDLLWPDIKMKLVKYRPFFVFDKDKFRQVIVDYFINKT